MNWFLHASEQTDGYWSCSHGGTIYDRHDVLLDAVEHLDTIAETMRPATLIIHWLDGSVHTMAPLLRPDIGRGAR